VGEKFDPQKHEAVQEVDDVAGESHTIVKILRYGYKTADKHGSGAASGGSTGDRILRPAQVITKK
jgi:molecular chaperone GrpE (heat shock protein)